MIWVKVLRGIRGGIWGLAAGSAIFMVADFETRSRRYDSSAFQQNARASIGLFELLGVLIVALSVDRVLELRERGMLESHAAKAKEALERGPAQA